MHCLQLPSPDNPTPTKQVRVVTSNSIKKPREKWPEWAKAIASFKSDTDKGVGDTVERTIGHKRSAKFKAWFVEKFGKSCGCSERKEKWNKEYAY